jgi:hypothetical protein
MGESEPAPIEEDVPPEFFGDEYRVYNSIDKWFCNWRASLENYADAHATYVHRNSSQSFWNPSRITARGTWQKPEVINGRALINGGRGRTGGGRTRGAQLEKAWRDWYPSGKFYWPRTEYRRLWVWAFRWRNKRRAKRPMVVDDPEWQGGLMHLPCMVRTDGDVHQFTRWPVPIQENLTRMWWFHSIKPQNKLAAIYEKIHFTLWNDWSKNYNFNGGDARQEIYQYYDKPEKLSTSDVWTIAWRKLQMTARGMPEHGIEGVPLAEEFAEFDPIPEAPAQEQEQLAQTGGGGL